MGFLLLILLGFGFYMVLRTQGLELQIQKLQKSVQALEDQLRKLHVKIVNQLPGFLETEAIKPVTPPPVQPIQPVQPIKPPEPIKPSDIEMPAPKPVQPILPSKPFDVKKPIIPVRPALPAFKMPEINWEQFMGVKLF